MITAHDVDLAQGRIRYLRAGEEGSPVVLLHGGGLDNAGLSWKYALPALAERHRVYAPDWPKHGRSRPWQGRADQAGLEKCLLDLLDHWELPSAALVGLSMGGAAVVGLALKHPERAARLVLAGCGGLQERVAWHRLSRFAVQPLPARLTGLLLTRRVLRAALARSTFKSPVPELDDLASEVYAELRRKPGRDPYSDWQRHEIGRRAMRTDHTGRLGELACPAFLVHGADDDLVPVARAREAAALIPGSELRVLEECGHWVPRERPDAFLEAVAEFLSR